TTLTNADGLYRFFGLDLGQHLIAVLPATTAPASFEVTDIHNGRHELDLTVDPAAALSGIVRSADGLPAQGVVVTLSSDGHTTTAAVTDADGRYLFIIWQPGGYQLDARGNGLSF